MSNSVMTIQPYRKHGTWVFDDPRTDLVAEAFVSGMPAIIDALVTMGGIDDASKGFRLLFSAGPFPGHALRLKWVGEETGGNWYEVVDSLGMRGWLCPALFKYFDEAPRELFARAEPLHDLVAG